MPFSANWDESQPDGSIVNASDIDLWDRNIQRNTRERIEAFLGITDFVAQTPAAGTTLAGSKLNMKGTAASSLVPGATSFSIRNNADAVDNLLIANNGDVTVRNALTAAGLATFAAGMVVGTSLIPACWITRDTAFAMTTAAIPFTAELFDNYSLFDLGSPTRITFSQAGNYLIILTGSTYNTAFDDIGSLVLLKNGITLYTQGHASRLGSANRTVLTLIAVQAFVSTDYIEFLASQTNGQIQAISAIAIKLP
jgi:hypothetical protein